MGLENALKVALIGCGRMGVFTAQRVMENVPQGWFPLNHADAILSIEGLDLVALCEQDKEQLLNAAKKLSVEHVFSDYKELIATIHPDIISVATRTAVRCEILDYAIDSGVKGIHAEKPLGTNLKECNDVILKAKHNNVKISYGTYRRYMEIYRKAKEIVCSGDLGHIIEVDVQHGRAPLLWAHPHSVDLLNYFCDSSDLDFVQAACAIEEGEFKNNVLDADPAVEFAYFKYKNGVSGLISSASGMNTQITCSEGVLTVKGDGSFMEINRRKGASPLFLEKQKIELDPKDSGTVQAFKDLKKAMATNENPGITYEELLASQRMLFGMVQSSLSGGIKTKLSDVDETLVVTGRMGELYA